MPSSSESDISSSQLKMSAAGVSSFRHYLGCRKGGRSSEPGSPDVLNMVEELNKKLKSFLHAATEDDSVEVVVGESRVEDSEERVSELERENRELADENVLLRQTRKEGVVIQVNNNQTTSNCLTQVQQGGSASFIQMKSLYQLGGSSGSTVTTAAAAASAPGSGGTTSSATGRGERNVEREALASSCASAGARTYNCSTTTTPALCGTPALLREGVSALTQPQFYAAGRDARQTHDGPLQFGAADWAVRGAVAANSNGYR
eukprot:g8310.t1